MYCWRKGCGDPGGLETYHVDVWFLDSSFGKKAEETRKGLRPHSGVPRKRDPVAQRQQGRGDPEGLETHANASGSDGMTRQQGRRDPKGFVTLPNAKGPMKGSSGKKKEETRKGLRLGHLPKEQIPLIRQPGRGDPEGLETVM
jgi:hypothetical protein